MMRKQYTAAFKARVVQEMLKEEKTLAQIAAEFEVHATQLKNWRMLALEGLPGLFEKQDSTAELKAAHEQQLTELYAEIGKLTTQVAWLKKNRRCKDRVLPPYDRVGLRCKTVKHPEGGSDAQKETLHKREKMHFSS